MGGKDFKNQQWSTQGSLLSSLSAPGKQCATLSVTTPQDCGTSLWFADDSADGQTLGETVYAVATFGELRGGNLSLVSSRDDMVTWKDEGLLLTTRAGHWDNATLSTGPSPVRLRRKKKTRRRLTPPLRSSPSHSQLSQGHHPRLRTPRERHRPRQRPSLSSEHARRPESAQPSQLPPAAQ